ncbi:CoF synthetase [Mesorhizobium sp. B2-4-12]|uniref:phenylacetate--CoA ligase family protein n=1 Tax=Mesorhizobium sp. B2-4-12 TaxID=2589937 RepID=UPI001126FFA2|nr:CoF synthetase [Mesorhizobium sp. B2-4-12]TPK97464.1 CoF synthetase [Mesorhizobium sp. B2-4-12]
MRLMKHMARPFFLFLVAVVNLVEGAFASSRHAYRLLLVPGFERVRWGLGAWRAWANFYHAYDRVPAYRAYIDSLGGKPEILLDHVTKPDLTSIPEMDKESYVRKYSQEERVLGGILPSTGVTVDESSGSSGTPTSWVRGRTERRITTRMMQMTFHRITGEGETIFILNAFALGAWATGMNVAISLSDTTILKSTGPNLDKIINTIHEFGPRFRYVVMGYPPFLKTLADDPRLDWSKFTIDAAFGGEGVSESLRGYLLKKFQRVVGSYGASDLEVNMALESELTINLRRALLTDERLREAIIRVGYGVTPMIFQYNPLAYHLEENAKGELVATISRPYNISPKIRYNIHDRGHVLRFGDLRRILKRLGREDILKASNRNLDLPLLFIYGRSDMSIEYYGAKVTPDSLREILFGLDILAPVLSTFRLISYEDAAHNKRMEVAIELVDAAVFAHPVETLQDTVFTKLAAMNGDFLNAWKRTATAENMPELKIYAFNTGPFEGGQRRLKNEYVASKITYDKL